MTPRDAVAHADRHLGAAYDRVIAARKSGDPVALAAADAAAREAGRAHVEALIALRDAEAAAGPIVARDGALVTVRVAGGCVTRVAAGLDLRTVFARWLRARILEEGQASVEAELVEVARGIWPDLDGEIEAARGAMHEPAHRSDSTAGVGFFP